MTLKERLQSDTTAAMRSGDALRRDTLRMVQNSAYNLEKKSGKPLTDEELLAVVAREVKTRRESVEAFRKGGREDLATKEEAEIAILGGYLPEQLGEAEIGDSGRRGDQGHRRRDAPGPRQGDGLALAADPWPGRRQAASASSSRPAWPEPAEPSMNGHAGPATRPRERRSPGATWSGC